MYDDIDLQLLDDDFLDYDVDFNNTIRVPTPKHGNQGKTSLRYGIPAKSPKRNVLSTHVYESNISFDYDYARFPEDSSPSDRSNGAPFLFNPDSFLEYGQGLLRDEVRSSFTIFPLFFFYVSSVLKNIA